MHILVRSLALIVMGFFHVNLENYSQAAVLPYPLWELLITIGFFLVWLDYPADMDKRKRYGLTGAGILTGRYGSFGGMLAVPQMRLVFGWNLPGGESWSNT